jgi:amidohydrolase
MILAKNKENLTNSVKFLFQPDEEGNGGAERMIKAGALENPKVSAVYGAHVYPELPFGVIGTKKGPLMAISTAFDIFVYGKSAHGAERKAGNDALGAAAEITKYALSLNRKDTVLTVGAFHSGTIRNIIADKAVLNATLRTLTTDRKDEVLNKLHTFADKLCKKYGVTYEIIVNRGYIGICNKEENFKTVKKVSSKLFGAENSITLKDATMKSEDFGYFINNSSGCFYFAGVGGEYALHNSHFAPDNKALINVAALQAALSQE